jgi:hypothetical protein
MRTLGARFARVIGVQLYLPTEGARLVRLPGALIVLALGATRLHTLRLRPAPQFVYNVAGNGRRNEKAGRLTPASRLWP